MLPISVTAMERKSAAKASYSAWKLPPGTAFNVRDAGRSGKIRGLSVAALISALTIPRTKPRVVLHCSEDLVCARSE